MPKVATRKFTPDWSRCGELPRATWDFITSPELAEVLGVSLQTISNMKLRKLIPQPEYQRAHRNFYRISTLRAFFENRTEDEIHMAFIREYVPYANTLEEAQYYVLHAHSVMGIDKPRPNAPVASS